MHNIFEDLPYVAFSVSGASKLGVNTLVMYFGDLPG